MDDQPVNVGDELTLPCLSIGKQGDGIFKEKGFVIIVPEAELDKTYTIRVERVLSNISFGKIVEG